MEVIKHYLGDTTKPAKLNYNIHHGDSWTLKGGGQGVRPGKGIQSQCHMK